MSANVETMFYVSNEENNRFVPWHGLGTSVEEAPTSADALRLAGLDWEVIQKPIFVDKFVASPEVPGWKANVRSSDNTVLGIVTDRYKIVQNKDAFDFTDALIGNGDVHYETAGSLRNGKTVWLLAKMPSVSVLGDQIDPYICFANSHDGTGAIKVCMTPIRVVCNNTLNAALSGATRCWTTRHIGDISSKMEEARATLKMANKYMGALAVDAERLANERITEEEISKILDEIFPITETDSDRKKSNKADAKNQIMICYLAPDIAKFMGTKWGFLNAVSDWCGHATPKRMTTDYALNNWGRIMDGHPVFDRAYELCNKAS